MQKVRRQRNLRPSGRNSRNDFNINQIYDPERLKAGRRSALWPTQATVHHGRAKEKCLQSMYLSNESIGPISDRGIGTKTFYHLHALASTIKVYLINISPP